MNSFDIARPAADERPIIIYMSAAHFYIDAIALGISALGLVPIYKDIGRKFFVIFLGILLAATMTASFWMTSVHRGAVERTKQHLLEALRGGQKTFDELAHSLAYNELGQLSEA